MASFSVMTDFQVEKNEAFLEKARALSPNLIHRQVPVRAFWQGDWQQEKKDWKTQGLSLVDLRAGSEILLDFGEHAVGTVTFQLGHFGSHPDAPAYLYLKFAERLPEFEESSEDYQGWLGRGWLPEEYVHVDVLDGSLTVPRRHSFRYLLVKVLDTSPKYGLSIQEVYCDAVSAGSMEAVAPVAFQDDLLASMDHVGLCTLRDCMQDIFEDGAKRDCRLWLGDFRLTALTNYFSFKDYDLAKRCLYLFAGLTFNGGKLPACLFVSPTEEPDDTFLQDFALMFVPALKEYYEASGDRETLEELYETAMNQIRHAIAALDENGVMVNPGDAFTVFLDWGDGLDKQAGGTGALLYCMNHGLRLAAYMEDFETGRWLKENIEKVRKAAMKAFWDQELGLFVSGPGRQVSWASQIYLVLGGCLPVQEARQVLARVRETPGARGINTPYLYHYYIEALLSCGDNAMALEEIKRYWGGMVLAGADTFWEMYDPENLRFSPYGSLVVNSYCHAWSCTVSYFLRTYFAGQ